MENKFFFQFEITINVLVSSIHFILIPTACYGSTAILKID